jgi:hypothetical protein
MGDRIAPCAILYLGGKAIGIGKRLGPGCKLRIAAIYE